MRPVPVLAAVIAGLALAGCSAAGPASTRPTSARPAPAGPVAVSTVKLSAETATDIGDGRPAVSYDGLMVRRRVVIAVHPGPHADLADVRRRLDRRAARAHVVLTSISPGVLSPAELAHLVPELIVALPIGQPTQVADAIVNPPGGYARAYPGVDHFHVDSVLVHDLAFTVRTAKPARARRAMDREGILADALGTYSSRVGAGELRVTYSGPLLGDDLVHLVQRGIARAARVAPVEVTVQARSSAGLGVNLATEPPEAAESAAEEAEEATEPDHDHH